MGNSSSMMTQVQTDILANVWNEVLLFQARLFAPIEYEFLKAAGLGHTNKQILDVGCGTGHYGLFLAEQLSRNNFLGLEENELFLNQLGDLILKKNIRNYSFKKYSVGKDLFPKNLKGQFAQCLMRLVLQHTAKPLMILEQLYEELPVGGKIFVIEEDDYFANIYPPCSAYDEVFRYWKITCNQTGTSRHMGRQVPTLLIQAGFNVQEAQFHLHNNFQVGEELLNYFIATVRLCQLSTPNLIDESAPERIRKTFMDYKRAHKKSWLAIYPQIFVVGEKLA